MPADRRRQILSAAYEIVGSEGLEGLHARSVAARVGVNHAAVHYYYPTRPDLLLALTKYAMTRFLNDRAKLMTDAVTPQDKAEAHMAQAEAYSKANSRFLKNWVSYFVAAISDESIRNELSEHLKEWSATLKGELSAGSKAGFKTGSPFSNADLLVASMLGLMIAAQTVGPSYDISEKLDLISGSLLG